MSNFMNGGKFLVVDDNSMAASAAKMSARVLSVQLSSRAETLQVSKTRKS